MKKYFKVLIRLTNDDRVEVIVRADSVATLAQDFKGTQITFIPNKQADFDSFTIFINDIKRIDYKAVSFTPFDNPIIHDILSY